MLGQRPAPPPPREQNDTRCKSIILPQLLLRAVKIQTPGKLRSVRQRSENIKAIHVFQDPGTIRTDETNVLTSSIKSEPQSATSSETPTTPGGSAQQSAVSASHLLNNVPALGT